MIRFCVLLVLLCAGACVINASPVPDSTPATTTTTHSDDEVQIVNYSNDNIGANGYNFAYVFAKLYFNNLIIHIDALYFSITFSPTCTLSLSPLLRGTRTNARTTASRPAMGCHVRKWQQWNMLGPYRSRAQSAGPGRMVCNIRSIMLPMRMASNRRAHICRWAPSQRLRCSFLGYDRL